MKTPSVVNSRCDLDILSIQSGLPTYILILALEVLQLYDQKKESGAG